MEIFCRRLAPEALQLAKDTVTAGVQPARVRKLLQDKFGSHLISKDLINLKQTLAGVKLYRIQLIISKIKIVSALLIFTILQ